MTRPMSEEREKALKVAAHVLRAEEVHGPSAVILARALLSTSASERGMREALEKAAEALHDAAYGGATVTRLIMAEREALAALSSKGEGE